MGITLEIHVILFWVYWFFLSLMIALMFMDVGDTHDEAIFGSLFVYLYKNYFT